MKVKGILDIYSKYVYKKIIENIYKTFDQCQKLIPYVSSHNLTSLKGFEKT